MTRPGPFRYLKTSPEIICSAVMLYIRYPLSLRNVEDFLQQRGIEDSHETIRFWLNRFAPMFATEIRRKRGDGCGPPLNGNGISTKSSCRQTASQHYLWRAVDHEGEVLGSIVSKTHNHKAALKFLRKSIKRLGWPQVFVTVQLRSYGAALKKDLGMVDERQKSRWMNTCAENSHLPVRRRDRPCSASRGCDHCKSSSQSIPRSTTISTRSALRVAGTISKRTDPPLWLSGGSFLPPEPWWVRGNRDWFALVCQHRHIAPANGVSRSGFGRIVLF